MLHWRSETRTSRNADSAVRLSADGHVTDLISLMGACIRFERGEEIFAEDEAADYIYKVVSGAVRLSKLMSDGRRQIGAFYLPGDIFGVGPLERSGRAVDMPVGILTPKLRPITSADQTNNKE